MFYDDKEVFDDDTCSEIGIEHEQIIRVRKYKYESVLGSQIEFQMHVTIDTLFTKNRDGESFWAVIMKLRFIKIWVIYMQLSVFQWKF